MTDWNIWVRDRRNRPLLPAEARELVTQRLHTRQIEVLSGPHVLLPLERHVGEWVFGVRDLIQDNVNWSRQMLVEALVGSHFELCGDPYPRPPARPPLRRV